MNKSKPKFNVVTTKTAGDKSYYSRIGVAFPLEKSPGFSILSAGSHSRTLRNRHPPSSSAVREMPSNLRLQTEERVGS